MAARYDADTIRRVKMAAPLVDIVGRHVTLSPSGDVRRGRCPLHMDMHGRFKLDLKQRSWECAACEEHGDVLDFVQRYDRVDFARAVAIVAEAGGVVLPALPGMAACPAGRLL